MRIRPLLFFVAAVILIPVFLAAAIAVEQVREGERQAALRGLHETVRATSLLVDGEVLRSIGALSALGNSPHLAQHDLAGFYQEAKALDRLPSVWTLLLDETGTQLINTVVPMGTPPPAPVGRERVAKVLATGRPLVSDLIIGPVTGKLLTTIYAPTPTQTGGRYVVAQAFSVDHWKNTALQPQGRSDWIVAVIDSKGKFIARSRNTAEFLGRQARAELVAAAAAAHSGLIRHKTLEGVEAYDAFTHSAQTGWTIAVAAPVQTIEASATQAVYWLSAGVILALAAATAAAWYFGRQFIQGIETASKAARALGTGQQPLTPRTSLHEINALNESLADAGRLQAAERRARQALEAERKGLLDKETAAREAAQAQNAAKDQFLALLGHELRNPLAAISGAAAILARERDKSGEPDHYLGMVQRQTRHLTHIVNDLLDVSRMLSGRILLETQALNLADCVRSCVEALQATERAAGYRLRVEARDAWIMGDAVRIEQLVNNLLSNALKYAPDGSEIRVEAGVNEEDLAFIKVTDAGMGIAESLMPRIFEPFFQGPTFPGRAPNGLGIGLSLVKQLAELHDGEVEVSSAGEGQGSSFSVILPQVPAPPLASASGHARSQAPVRRIMLVEDNPDTMEATAELLRMMGYEVKEACDGDEALALASSCQPDVIVMDIGLPGKSGYQLAAEFKQTPQFSHIPLIALSGYGLQREARPASTADFSDYLIKPVDPDRLVQAIEASLLSAAAATEAP